MDQKSTYNRIQELDALRGIAVFAVLLYHYTTRYNQIYNNEFDVPFSFKWGFMGVELFFIISGFVILMTLERKSSFKAFSLSRFSRLFPTFWVAATLTFVATLIWHLPGRSVAFQSYLANLTMLPKKLGFPYVDGAYWSLEVELIFYVIIFILFKIFDLKRIEWAIFLWLGLTALHVTSFSFAPFNEYLLFNYSIFFAAGMLYYRLYQNPKRWINYLLIAVCIWLEFRIYHYDNIHNWVVVGFHCLFFLFIFGYLKWINRKPLLFLGTISYPLYVIHQNIGYLFIKKHMIFVKDYPNLFLVLTITLVVGLAWLIHYFIEKKATNQLRKWLSEKFQTKV